jgi:hypothetical protein
VKIIFISVFLFSSIIYAQVDSAKILSNSTIVNSEINDSLSNEKFVLPKPGFKYSLPSYSFYKDRIEFNHDALNYFDHQIYNPTPQSLSNDFKLYNQQLQSAMKLIPGFQKKKDLGVFGEILGYTNAAATLGLLIYHLHKYKDKY